MKNIKKLLKKANEEELDLINEIIGKEKVTFEMKGRTIEAFVPLSVDDIIKKIQWLSKSLLGYVFGEEKSYKSILLDVAKKLKIKADCSLEEDEIELRINKKIMEDLVKKMKKEEKEKFEELLMQKAREFGYGEELMKTGTIFASLFAAQASGFGVYLLASTTLGALTSAIGITLPFAVYTTLSSAISVAIGPVGWITAGIFAFWKLTGPNYKKLIPLVVAISSIRARIKYEEEQKPKIMKKLSKLFVEFQDEDLENENKLFSKLKQINNEIKQNNKLYKKYDLSRIKCCILGMSGVGKSSLINAIAGQKIAETDVVETTMIPKEFYYNGILFVDLPGYGTQTWEKDYIEDLELDGYDVYLLVTSNRIYENDINLYQYLKKKRKKVFLIRNKIDQSILEAERENTGSVESLLQKIQDNYRENFDLNKNDKVYIITTRDLLQFDFRELLNDIFESLNEVQKKRFMIEAFPMIPENYERKKEHIKELVDIYSAELSIRLIESEQLEEKLIIYLSDLAKMILNAYGLINEKIEFAKYPNKERLFSEILSIHQEFQFFDGIKNSVNSLLDFSVLSYLNNRKYPKYENLDVKSVFIYLVIKNFCNAVVTKCDHFVNSWIFKKED